MLEAAQLQGASLHYVELEGATLLGADLQGASLTATQLQGADLTQAQLQGTWINHPFVWRTRAPDQQVNGPLVIVPEPGAKYFGRACPSSYADPCNWTETSYAALKSLIENSAPAGLRRAEALARIAKLEKPPYSPDLASAEAWGLAKASSPLAASYLDTQVKTLIGIGCADEGAPYVISGLIRQLRYRFEQHLSQEAGVAKVFLDELKCPGAHGLSAADKATLQRIVRQAPASAGPGAPSQ